MPTTRTTASPKIERRLAAIMVADVAGYSRLMGIDEVGTHNAQKDHGRERIDPTIARHNGRVIRTVGDGLVVEFASVVDAVSCAVAIQRAMLAFNEGVHTDRQIILRIGINIGDIIVPGFADLGERTVKNIAQAIGVFGLISRACLKRGCHSPSRRSCGDLGRGRRVDVHNKDSAPTVSVVAPTASRPAAYSPEDRRLSTIVLPFENSSGDPAQDGIAADITRDVIGHLAMNRYVPLIPAATSAVYRGKSVDLRKVGRDHDVHFALTGNARRQDGA